MRFTKVNLSTIRPLFKGSTEITANVLLFIIINSLDQELINGVLAIKTELAGLFQEREFAKAIR
ncbi:MAG: hypothetical protein EBY83_07900, partial [Verrucomicrobia bacterium]|nr:hypothetical protein [Verrucomicrobiota bacterium]